ncbi:OLC1v1030277C1 [Oldenlandia corymbosa var. corymbosa]|nr:OLC1v1030277C1 [Oldenlandia corymbosa var. corymbosa]
MEDRAFDSSVDLGPEKRNDNFHSQTDLVDPNESVQKPERRDDTSKEVFEIEPPLILEKAEEKDKGNSQSRLDNDFPEAHGLEGQHRRAVMAEIAQSGHMFEVGVTSQLDCMQWAQDSGASLNPVKYTASSGKPTHYQSHKVGLHQHGISRRLQFEDAHSKKLSDIGVEISSGSLSYRTLPASTAGAEVRESSTLHKTVSASNIFSPPKNGNHNTIVPKPSGIGLHLNSIIAKQKDSASKFSRKSEVDSFDGLGKKSISVTSSHLYKNYSISSDVGGGSSFTNNRNVCDTPAPIDGNPAKSSYNIKPFFEPVILKPKIQLQTNSLDKGQHDSETFNDLGNSVQSSPKKKRKKTMNADDNGFKRCNCKKTKCLKLYCDCFAANNFCDESCACQDCFNKSEYEDTVALTKKQITDRNPSAFQSKIVKHSSESSGCTDNGDSTPSSARHKRGCNCKKSKCLKKYCECYQANVGCSDGCRCEGCDNIYGRKEDYGIIKDQINRQVNSESLDSSFEIMLSKDGSTHNDLYSPQNLTPLTPQFQSSVNGKGGWFSSGRYLLSPDSGLSLLTPFGVSPVAAGDPDSRDLIPETNSEIMDLAPFPQDFSSGYRYSANQFSQCDGPSSMNHSSPAAFPNPQDWVASAPRAQIVTGNRHVSTESSLRWRRSPITPSIHIGASKLHQAAEFEERPYSIVDDDTPEILKENPEPTGAVKVSSPNKKRVSPPHGGLTQLTSCSSEGVRTCRRFVLKGIPTMPPRTPHIQSQVDPAQNTDNAQSSSSSK